MSDPSQIRLVKEIARPEILFALACEPQASRLFVGASDHHLYELDVAAEKPDPQPLSGHESYVTGAVLAGGRLISGGYDGRLIWWDVESRQPLRTIDAHARCIRQLAATPDGTTVVSVADDMVARVWNAASGVLVRELRGHEATTPQHFPSMLYACAISSDGKFLATGDRVGHNIVWELNSGKQLAQFETPLMYTWDPKQRIHSIGGVRSLAFSPDARLVAAGGIGQIGNIDHLDALARVEVFDWRNNERTHEFPGDTHKGLVERLAFHPDGKWLLGAGGDHGGFFQFFDLDAGKIRHQDKAPMHVHDFSLDASAETIYAVGHRKIVVWSLAEEATS